MMRNNKIMIATVAVVVLTIVAVVLNHTLRNGKEETSASDESYREQLRLGQRDGGWKNISNEDVKRFWASEAGFSEQNIRQRFSGSVVNHDTLQFFRFMDDLFKDAADAQECFEKARLYLDSVLPPEQAKQMLDLYKTYVNYQVEMQTKMKEWSIAGASSEALDNLARIREYRRAVFGKENADLIFGVSEKADEYAIRRRMILADGAMFGFEKERRLGILNEMMWGGETMPFDANLTSYARYQEKLNLYGRDLSDARSASEKEATLDKIRRETFTPEELQRMDDAKRYSAREAQARDEYYAREKDIRNSNLDAETKDSQIRDLQNQTFGAEADAFRRQEAMTRGLEDARKKAAQDAREAQARSPHRTPEEALEELNKKMREQQQEADSEASR